MSHIKMKDLPETEQPYVKMKELGANYLSDAELLAIVIKTGTKNERAIDVAHRLLLESGGGLLGLYRKSLPELQEIRGIGPVKAIQIKAVMELSRRISQVVVKNQLKLNDSESVAAYYMEEMRHLSREKFKVLLQDGKGGIVKEVDIAWGSVNHVNLDPKEVYREAIKEGASFIILLHNHPSGDPTPSEEDILLTKKMAAFGQAVDIKFRDHIIIGDRQFRSLGYLCK